MLGQRTARRLAPLKAARSEEHTSELQSQSNLVCRLLLEKKKQIPCNSTQKPNRRRSATAIERQGHEPVADDCNKLDAAARHDMTRTHDGRLRRHVLLSRG